MKWRFLFLTAVLVFGVFEAGAATRTWDGGGTTNNWSEPANWSADTAPTASDDVVFNATSTKPATIDQTFTVVGVQIQSGYTATLTQNAGVNLTVNGGFTQAAGSFQGSNGSITINGTLQITGGAFAGGTGSISGGFGSQFNQSGGTFSSAGDYELTTFSLSGGTFNAPSGTLTVVADFTHTAGGTFNAGTGTVRFTGYNTFNCINQIIINVNVSETFNNLTIANQFCNSRFISAGDTLIVNGDFRIAYGRIAGGRIRPLGTTTIDPTNVGYGGGSVVEYVTPNTSFVINNPATAADMFTIEMNAPNSTLTSSGAGKINFYGMTLTNGTLNQPNSVWDFSAYPGYAQTGGVFNGSAAQLNISNGAVTGSALSGGTFNGGGGLINGGWTQSGGTFSSPGDMNVAGFTLTGGTFNAPLGTLDVYSGFVHTAGGVFNPRTGTVQTSALPGVFGLQFDVATTETFNNLKFNGTNNSANHLIASGDTLIVNGTLAFSGRGVNGGTITANGDITYLNYGAYQNATTVVRIDDLATRTITLCGETANCGGAIEANIQPTVINNPNVTVNAGLTANGSMLFPSLTLQQGTFNQGAGRVSMNIYNQSGGTYNGGTFAQSFANLNNFANFTLTGGDFNAAPSMTLTGNFTHTTAAGNFNEGTGIVYFYSTFFGTNGTVDVNGSESFHDIAFYSGNGTTIASGDKLIATGNVTLRSGSLNGGTVEVKGNVDVARAIAGGSFLGGTTNVLWSAATDQTFTNQDGFASFGGAWTVNKPNSVPATENAFAPAAPTLLLISGNVGRVSAGSFPTMNIVSGNVAQTGSFDQALGSLTLAAGTSFVNDFGGTLTLAGSVVNDGLIRLNASGAGCQTDTLFVRSSSAAQRSWTGSGVFTLVDTDVSGQAGTAPIRVYSGTNSGNNGANFVFDSSCLVPTAASVSIAGRVVSSDGAGLARVTVTLTGADGIGRVVSTNSFGNYRFDDVASGQFVTVAVSGRKYSFAAPTQIVGVFDNVGEVNFTAQPK